MPPNEGLEPRLPFAARALVEERKIVEYLLNREHPVGASKTKFFLSCGFSLAEWVTLRQSLVTRSDECANEADRDPVWHALHGRMPLPDTERKKFVHPNSVGNRR